MLYGGSIRPGSLQGRGGHDPAGLRGRRRSSPPGKITEEELHELEEAASPGAGACGGQFTANTMAMAFEVLGISPAGSAMVPAEDGRKLEVARQCGELVMDVLRRGQRPSDVITKPALENAIAAVATSGGSTNGVLHLLAVAREMGVPLTIDEFEQISERTPLLCDLQPGGRYAATDLYEAGGVPLVLARLKEAGILHEDAADGHRRDDRRARRRGARDRRPARRAAAVRRRSNRPAASRSCAATSPRTAASSSSPATSGANTPAPRACSTARRRRWRPCSRKRSSPATWS